MSLSFRCLGDFGGMQPAAAAAAAAMGRMPQMPGAGQPPRPGYKYTATMRNPPAQAQVPQQAPVPQVSLV